MPQMMPMNWLITPMIFIIFYLLFLSKMFFINSLGKPLTKTQSNNKIPHYWMW